MSVLVPVYFVLITLLVVAVLGSISTYKEYKQDSKLLKKLEDKASSDDK